MPVNGDGQPGLTSISVIIPVHNSAGSLSQCLDSLGRSQQQILECIVVDDASSDDSAAVARERGAVVLSTLQRRGPAYARNAGAAAAHGALLVFLDADVCVHPDTLGRIANAFRADPDLTALIGSYDDSPRADGFFSQFRNLSHCYVHQTSRPEACTFWAGCGAIRRPVFFEHGGFDVTYRRPAIEDIELGFRMRRAGCKLALDRQVLVTHLKNWTFLAMLKTDILDRGIPWTKLILRHRWMPNDLNLRWSQRFSVLATFAAAGVAALAALRPWVGAASPPESFLLGLLAVLLAAVAILNFRFFAFLASKRGWGFSLTALPVYTLFCFYGGLSFLVGAGAFAGEAWLPAFRAKTKAQSAEEGVSE